MSDLIPVHLNVRLSDGVISVQMLLNTSIGTGVVDGEPYKRIGQIMKRRAKVSNRLGQTTEKDGFQWHYDEPEWGRTNGWEPTKAGAVQALLKAGGYVEAPPNAANPGLF